MSDERKRIQTMLSDAEQRRAQLKATIRPLKSALTHLSAGEQARLAKAEHEFDQLGARIALLCKQTAELKAVEDKKRAESRENLFVDVCREALSKEAYLAAWRAVSLVENGTSVEDAVVIAGAATKQAAEEGSQARLSRELQSAQAFVDVAKIVLAERTFSSIHARAMETVRYENRKKMEK